MKLMKLLKYPLVTATMHPKADQSVAEDLRQKRIRRAFRELKECGLLLKTINVQQDPDLMNIDVKWITAKPFPHTLTYDFMVEVAHPPQVANTSSPFKSLLDTPSPPKSIADYLKAAADHAN